MNRKFLMWYIFFIRELNKYDNKIMGQSNIMKHLMQKKLKNAKMKGIDEHSSPTATTFIDLL